MTLLLHGALLLLVWVWLLYPLTMAVLAALRPRPGTTPAPTTGDCPTLSVVIAAHNEADTIESRIDDLLAQDYPRERLQIVVASDGSTDATETLVAHRAAAEPRILLVTQHPQVGRAGVHNLAVQRCSGEIVLFTDAETRFETGFLRRMAAAFADEAVGMASGRLVFHTPPGGVAQQVGLYWRMESRLIDDESTLGIGLFGSGACLAVRRELYRAIPDTGDVDTVVALDVVSAGRRCVWVRDAVARDTLPAAVRDEFRARVRMTAKGLHSSFTRLPALEYLRRPRLTLVLLSHKAGRWVGTPLALLALLPTSLALASSGGLPALVLFGQALFYAAAAADGLGWRVPLGNAARGFCVANAAFALGTLQVVTGRVTTRYRPTRQGDAP